MWKRIEILRVAVTAGLLAAAIICGTVSYITVSGYEKDSATQRFHNIAHYAQDTLASDFMEKENAVLAIAKNMAYITANESAWPNVVIPGFYDVGFAQRDSAKLDDIYFLPLVQPEQLHSFEHFMYDYYASEPLIGNKSNTPIGHGVYGINPDGSYYHDITGEALWGSPNKIITPLFQLTFDLLIQSDVLARNAHSIELFGHGLDAIIACSKMTNYTKSGKCGDVTNILFLPFYAPEGEIKDVHSSIMQPIYLHQNTSKLVGFIGGGFDWIELFTNVFSNGQEGVDIVLFNSDTVVTFVTDDGTVRIKGLGDLHEPKYNHYDHSSMYFMREDGSHAYDVHVYPTDAFYRNFQTDTPIYGAVGSAVLLGLCAATFFFYDYYMRKSKAANEAVLETKRRFVRFISHEIRTPLNAVHLGLEALIAELRRTIGTDIAKGFVNRAMLMGWLELALEMMANSDSAEDVLNDLLNYDKIEMGTLYLEFSSVPIWEVVQANVNVFHTQMTQKKIQFNVENRLTEDIVTEQRDVSQLVVVGDSARIAQVMRNLIANALKFTPNHGTITVHVERLHGGFPHPLIVLPPETQDLLEQPRAGSVRISVTDSGAGLSEAQLAKIDTEGVQFNANELQAGKGSGLGLFITKGIVEQHGGKFTVTSAGIGAGTTFAVELPLFTLQTSGIRSLAKAPATTREPEIASSPQRPAHIEEVVSVASSRSSFTSQEKRRVSDGGRSLNSSPKAVPVLEPTVAVEAPTTVETIPLTPIETKPKRILVVDDVLSNRKMLSRILTAKGYTCEQAEDGQQAIDVYRAAVEAGNEFYAITMDFEMPVMNGPTATGHLRAMGCTIPIIAVTGNVLPDDKKYFMAQGATEVLGKPLNVAKFQELMLEHENSIN